jgi:hypothetical protein
MGKAFEQLKMEEEGVSDASDTVVLQRKPIFFPKETDS